MSLSTAESLQLLDPSEVLLCSRIQILPKPFLFIKELFFRELARRGGFLSKDAALRLVPLSAEGVGEDGMGRLEAIYDFYLGGGEEGDSSVGEEEEEEDGGSSSDDNQEAEAAEVEASLAAGGGKAPGAPDSPASEARLEQAVAGLMEATGHAGTDEVMALAE